MAKQWFEVNKNGLAKLLARKGKAHLVLELIQNAWDENTGKVEVELRRFGTVSARLTVTDDNPEGFKDLTHAYTLFAESSKKSDPSKRGRFNLGEKTVIALCQSVSIESTTGTIHFGAQGRTRSKDFRATGTRFSGIIGRLTTEEMEEIESAVWTLIPPRDVYTSFNGVTIAKRYPVASFEASLPSEISYEDGVLRRCLRKCQVEVYEPSGNEVASIYEMGIPIVETGDRYHVNITQKVPLNFERDNVPPSYLRTLRTLVLNHTAANLTPEEASKPWVGDALASKQVSADAVASVLDQRFGKARVVYDPSDVEANHTAASKGAVVVSGGSFSAEQWESIRRAGALPSAGSVYPSPKPFSPDGKPLAVLNSSEYTRAQWALVDFAKWFASKTIGGDIQVVLTDDAGWKFNGAFGPDRILYIQECDKRFSECKDPAEVLRFLIHEFGHIEGHTHLDAKYHDWLCRIGAKAVLAYLPTPELAPANWDRP